MAKKSTSKGKIFLGLIAVYVLAVVLLAFLSKETKIDKKTFVIGVAQEPDSLHPLFSSMMVGNEVQGLVFESMVEYTDQWELLPRVVESIPTVENGGLKKLDGNRLETTWKFKKDLKWSDGWPITAHDAVFAYNVVMDNNVPVVSRDLENRIEKIEAKDDQTLVITWKEPYAYTFTGYTFLPKHILEPVYKKDPTKFHLDANYNRKPLGNGPYIIEEWNPGASITLALNPNWPFEKPNFEKVIYKFVGTASTLETELVSGGIDAISPTSGELALALDFQKRKGEEFNFHYIDGMVWEHMDCNLDNEILKDKKVRQALLYGMDREGMSQKLFQGKQSVAHTWLPPKHYGYNPNVKKYPYDVAKAEALLDEAGWKKGSDGYRYKDGKLLEFTIMTTAGNPTRESVQVLVQSDWKKLGVKLGIQNQPANVFFGDTTNKRKFPHFAIYAWIQSPISDGEGLWTIKNIPSKENNWQGQNFPGWRNAEVDVIDSKVPVTLEESERKVLLQREQEIWSEELPAFPLFWRVEPSVTSKNIANWKPTGTSTPVTWNAEAWRAVAK